MNIPNQVNSQALDLTTVLLWEPHTATFSYAQTLSCLRSLSRGNVMMMMIFLSALGTQFWLESHTFPQAAKPCPKLPVQQQGIYQAWMHQSHHTQRAPGERIHTPGSFHVWYPSPAQRFPSESGSSTEMKFLLTITFAGTVVELQSLLRMEKISSWQAARGWKISRGTEREQVTDTSMDLPLNSSAGVISKSCLDIKTNENIFLPETLFTEEHLNSFVEKKSGLPF